MAKSTKDCGTKHIRVFGTIVGIVLLVVAWNVRWTGATVAESTAAIKTVIDKQEKQVQGQEARLRGVEQQFVKVDTKLEMIIEYIRKGIGNEDD